MLSPWRKKKDETKNIITVKCDAHEDLCTRLARIEGENIAIITMLGIILAVVIVKVV
jgi:hypothetical protein